MSGNRALIQFSSGSEVKFVSSRQSVRFLLVSGTPIEEPVTWHGPSVMNTREEIIQAVKELNNGTFIKAD